MKGVKIFFIFFSLFFIYCNQNEDIPKEDASIDDPTDLSLFKADYTISELSFTEKFSSVGKPIGEVELEEVSGMVESQINENSLWVINDSGNENHLYLIDKTTGKLKAAYQLKGIKNKDWESIEIGPGPKAGVKYIYLGDTGDNKGKKDSVTIYRFEEPSYEAGFEGKFIEYETDFEELRFSYPDGPRDSEAFIIDPKTLDLYIITKRDVPSRVYLFPYPQNTLSKTILSFVGTLPFVIPVGANVAADGQEILIKTYDMIFYWQHNLNDPLWKTLVKKPSLAPYNPIELQGEAICFDNKGGYFTLSEKVGNETPELYYYEREIP